QLVDLVAKVLESLFTAAPGTQVLDRDPGLVAHGALDIALFDRPKGADGVRVAKPPEGFNGTASREVQGVVQGVLGRFAHRAALLWGQVDGQVGRRRQRRRPD